MGRPHGLEGFLGLYVEEEDVVVFQPGSTVFVKDRSHVVRAVRRVDRGYQVAFEGVENRSAAEEIRGSDIAVDDRRRLTEGEFWPGDLKGLAVFDQTGEQVGVVGDVLFGPGQDRLRIDDDEGGPMFEIPFVDDLIPVVDLEAGRVEIVRISGLTEP